MVARDIGNCMAIWTSVTYHKKLFQEGPKQQVTYKWPKSFPHWNIIGKYLQQKNWPACSSITFVAISILHTLCSQ